MSDQGSPQVTDRHLLQFGRIVQAFARHEVLMQAMRAAVSGADAESIRIVAETEGNRIAAALNQRVLYIMDVGVLSPMLGLFGTVVGILNSFGHIASEASPMRTMLLAGGVSQALVATASGLVVGITAMAFYAYFRGRVGHLVSVLESEGTLLTHELILLTRRHRVAR